MPLLQVLLVDRPGLKQATVALGEPGVGLKDPDSPALDVLTSVLNNFGGRLFNQIRSREVCSAARQGLRLCGFWSSDPEASGAHCCCMRNQPPCGLRGASGLRLQGAILASDSVRVADVGASSVRCHVGKTPMTLTSATAQLVSAQMQQAASCSLPCNSHSSAWPDRFSN
jgi:hypothetical protein